MRDGGGMADEPSHGELAREITRNRTESREGLADLRATVHADLDALRLTLAAYVLREVWDSERKALTDRIEHLEANRDRSRQALITAIAAVVGAVVTVITQAILHS